MGWNRDKPAYNRATYDHVLEVCLERSHTLVSYEFPNLTVKCSCGNVFSKTFRAYKPQKSGCRQCDAERKKVKRPEHSQLMKGHPSFMAVNTKRDKRLRELYPPEVIAFMYEQKLTIKDISNCLGCGSVWIGKCLRERGIDLRCKNDYRNPTDSPLVREAISKNCKDRCAGGWKIKEEEKDYPATLYLVRYLDESGTHFKIGITRRTIQERLGDKLISIIHLHHATLGECFDLEQSLLKWARSQGYRYSSPTTTELLRPAGISHILSELNKCPRHVG